MPSVEYHDPNIQPTTSCLDSSNGLGAREMQKIQATRPRGYYSSNPKKRQITQAVKEAFIARDAHTRLLMNGYEKRPEQAHNGYKELSKHSGFNGYDEFRKYYDGDEAMTDCFSDSGKTLVGSADFTWEKEDDYFDRAARQAQDVRNVYGGSHWRRSLEGTEFTERQPGVGKRPMA